MENLNLVIANNISKYRKQCSLTQNELAQKLNFSDKSVSKWERGESIPDINVLMQMCGIFEININDLVYEQKKPVKSQKSNSRNKFIISLLSAGLVWFIATAVFVLLSIFAPNLQKIWLSFVYATPVSIIVLVVFSCLWGPKWLKFVFISALIWTIIIAICLTFESYLWGLLYIAIPIQILTILWFMLKKNKKTPI